MFFITLILKQHFEAKLAAKDWGKKREKNPLEECSGQEHEWEWKDHVREPEVHVQ